MSLSSSNRKAGPYTGNGSQTVFTFAFKVFQASDVTVIQTDLIGTETTLALTTNYTVSLNSDQNGNPGGSVTLLSAPASGYLITLTSSIDYLQAVTLTNQGGFYPNVINDALDRLTIFCQQLAQQMSRAVLVNISSSTSPSQLIASLIAASANAVASAASAATSASSASSSASSASTSATNASNSATTATAAASTASTAATNASSSAASALTNANAASTSATNAASSASTASTAATSATGSATSASTNAAAAATSATNASNSASSASTSATNAATSATNAANSAASVGFTASSTTTFTNKTLTGLKETKTAPSISAGTLTIDCSAGNVFAVSLNANISTLSFSNVPASGTAFGLTLSLTANGTAYTVTWPASVKWPGGTAPTLTSTSGKVDTFVLMTYDGGTTWYSFVAGQSA